jgi:phage terminase large subunit-like protein
MLLEAIRGVSAWDGMGEMSAEEITARLSDDQIDFLLQMQEAEAWDEKYRKFDFLFPDKTMHVGSSTYHARHLYQRHLEFFRLGAKIRARCFMAANRVGKCRTFNDLIEHPNGSTSRIGDLFNAAKPFDVWAFHDGHRVATAASHVIRKPAEQVVEVLLENGTTFSCSLDHRVLTRRGWEFVSVALSCAPCLPASSSEPARSVHAEGDRHSSRTVPDWKCGYSFSGVGCDVRLLRSSGIGPSASPSPADALPHIPASSHSDGQGSICSDSLSASLYLTSSLYDRVRCAVRSFGFLAQAAYRFARRSNGSRPGYGRLRAGFYALSRSVREGVLGLSAQAAWLSPDGVATNKVVAYRPAGFQDLYDLTVPGYGNYIADGIVHHNTFSAGGYEMACHLTGRYPPWWEGRRFRHPIRAWACGKTNETTRDIVQTTLLGDIEYQGSRKMVDGAGVIPKACIGLHSGSVTWKQGVADLIDTIKIQHVSGGWSKLGLKSYQQGRGAFEGTAQHVIWDDEEPPMDVYGEQMIRTATTKGIMMVTFTPLAGLSDVVQQFLPGEDDA